jgi:lipoyl(octanoyl) transferase
MLTAAKSSRDEISFGLKRLRHSAPVVWEGASTLVAYATALERMDALVEGIRSGTQTETVWLVEHPSIYTAGTSAQEHDLVEPDRFPVFKTGRGGQYTYHGPGQRVGYVMMNLRGRGGDVRAFVSALEQWLINTLAVFSVIGERREDRVGVWVRRGEREDKIAALGIRVRQGVTFHGVSLNVNPDLSHFNGIVPCGVTQHGVTSLADLGIPITMADVDAALRTEFFKLFVQTP